MSFHQDTVILSEYIASQTVVLHSSDFVLFASVSHKIAYHLLSHHTVMITIMNMTGIPKISKLVIIICVVKCNSTPQPVLTFQIWPISVKGMSTEAHNLKMCSKLQFFTLQYILIKLKFGIEKQSIGLCHMQMWSC